MKDRASSLAIIVALVVSQPVTLAQSASAVTAQAIATLQKHAAGGDADAQYNLGVTYYQGIVVPKNLERSAFWYRKAAEQGHVSAEYNLALQLMAGLGIPQNLREAIVQFRKAADKGDAQSQYMLGRLYEQGGLGMAIHDPDGSTKVVPPTGDSAIPKDLVLAAKWYRMAAEQDYLPAQNQLGLFYAAGTGVPQDYAEAYFWLSLATAGEDPKEGSSENDRDQAANHLTRAILLRTQQRTRNWLKSHPKTDAQR